MTITFPIRYFSRLVSVKEISETMRSMAREMEKVSSLVLHPSHPLT